MLLQKNRKIGKTIDELEVGERLQLTEKIEDQELLIYLGLTNDANPLYIQHDFAQMTKYEKPIVPSILLTGIITSAISKYLPGPGSHIIEQKLSFPKEVYHYSTITCMLEVIRIKEEKEHATIFVEAHDESNDIVITGTVKVVPPMVLKTQSTEQVINIEERVDRK